MQLTNFPGAYVLKIAGIEQLTGPVFEGQDVTHIEYFKTAR